LENEGWLRGRKEIAAYIGVNPNYIRQYFKAHSSFPAIFDGRLMIAKKEDIDKWLKNKSKRLCPLDGIACLK
jgi:hypothetical protein